MKFKSGDKAKTAVVFDFDGTLIDTAEIKIDNYVQAVECIFGAEKGEREIIRASSLRTEGRGHPLGEAYTRQEGIGTDRAGN